MDGTMKVRSGGQTHPQSVDSHVEGMDFVHIRHSTQNEHLIWSLQRPSRGDK